MTLELSDGEVTDAVRDWLVKKGVMSEPITTHFYDADEEGGQPLSINARVEFNDGEPGFAKE